VTAALRFDGVRVVLGHQAVLDDLTFSIEPGQITVLIGPNGSGKSTLMRCAAGIAAPNAGTVRIDGVDVVRDPVAAKSKLGYAVEPARLPPELTGRQCLELFAKARGLRRDAVEASLGPVVDALGYRPWVDVEVAFCSLGTRQKLGILLGLVGDPPLLLLDEVTNGLDPASAFVLKQHLVERAKSGVAILLATHALDIAERIADRVLLLGQGRIEREWSTAELATRRADPAFSLELDLVSAMPR
jgi:ABC-2 type transport system ATP-binding protein